MSNQQSGGSGFWWKLAGIAAITVIVAFLYGHVSAVMNAGVPLSAELPGQVWEHLKTAPMDVFHSNMAAAYFIVLIYILILVMSFAKSPKPKADMKGLEHGSNDFQTAAEMDAYTKKNVSPALEFDMEPVEKYLRERSDRDEKA